MIILLKVTDRKYTYQHQQPTRKTIRLLGSPRNINHQGQILTVSVLFNSNRGLWVFPSSVLFWIANSNNQPHFTHWVCCRGGHTIPRLHHSWLRATRNVNVRYISTCHTSIGVPDSTYDRSMPWLIGNATTFWRFLRIMQDSVSVPNSYRKWNYLPHGTWTFRFLLQERELHRRSNRSMQIKRNLSNIAYCTISSLLSVYR